MYQRSSSVTRTSSVQVFGERISDDATNDGVRSLKMKFWWFSVIASLNHALNYVVTSYATSLLSTRLGGLILGLSWVLNSVSGMTVANPIVLRFGFKYAMIISLFGYAFQLATVYWAIKSNDSTTAWVVAVIGSVISGFTSAVWWTAQGVYFDNICVRIDKLMTGNFLVTKSQVDEVRAEIAAHWTFIYQMADIIVFLSLSIFPVTGILSIDGVLFALVILGGVTACLGFTFESIGEGAVELSTAEIIEAILAVPQQYRYDARVTLMAPFVFGFGITTAMFAYYVNSSVVSDSSKLGTVALGFLEAWSYFVAVLSAYPYALVSNNVKQGQDWVIQFGSLSFLATGAVVIALTNDQLGTWQNILISKALYGLGRGVFEGSCRAKYASMFTGKDLTTAFSGQTLSAGFSGGICFFMFGVLNRTSIAAITIINGIAAVGCYFILMYGVDSTKRVSWSQVCASVCCFCCLGDNDAASRKYSSARHNKSAQRGVEKDEGRGSAYRISMDNEVSLAGMNNPLLMEAHQIGST